MSRLRSVGDLECGAEPRRTPGKILVDYRRTITVAPILVKRGVKK
jgi:hypothetical protein